MEDVEGIPHAASGLLDAGELEHVLEPVSAIVLENFLVFSEGASSGGVALEGIIQNTPYRGVVFLPLTSRVEIGGNRPPRFNDDEYRVFVSAQHTIGTGCWKKAMERNLYESIIKLRRLADVYLLGKERQEHGVLPLVVQKELLEIQLRLGPCD